MLARSARPCGAPPDAAVAGPRGLPRTERAAPRAERASQNPARSDVPRSRPALRAHCAGWRRRSPPLAALPCYRRTKAYRMPDLDGVVLGGFVGEPPFFLAISRVPRLISHVCWPFRFSPRQFDNVARARPRRAFRRVRRVRRVCSRGRSILGLLTKRIVCAVRTVPFCGAFTDVLAHGAVKKVRKTPLSACCFGDTLAAYRPKKGTRPA